MVPKLHNNKNFTFFSYIIHVVQVPVLETLVLSSTMVQKSLNFGTRISIISILFLSILLIYITLNFLIQFQSDTVVKECANNR